MAHLSEIEVLAMAASAQLGGRGYGVSIRQEIRRRTGRSVSIGSLYKALHRLERRGLVQVSVGESTSERGGRARKLIRLSPAGRNALEASIASIHRMVEGLDGIGGPA